VITGEFLMLKPIQVPSRAQSSEQCSSEDDDDVLFAVSNAHLTGPFSVVLDLLYDVTCTDSSLDVTGTITCSSSSNSIGSFGTSIMFIFAFLFNCQINNNKLDYLQQISTIRKKVKVRNQMNLYKALYISSLSLNRSDMAGV